MQTIHRNGNTHHRQLPNEVRPWLADAWRPACREMLEEVADLARILHAGGIRPSEIVRAVRRGVRH